MPNPNRTSIYTGDFYQKRGARGQQFRSPGTLTGTAPGNLTNRASTNSPVQFQTQRNYSQTFTGPIKLDENIWRSSQNQGMAQAAYAGNTRGYQQQAQRQGVRAGNKMQDFRAGLMGDSEAAKGVAEARKNMFNVTSENAAANLAFQERQAGEQGWLRDLLLDRDDVNYRNQMAHYKREIDMQLSDRQREVEDQIAARKREAMIASALFGGLGRLI